MINSLHYQKKIRKAFGLVESLIALVFVASTMILAIKTVAQGLQVSKQNEIRDQAAGIMFRGLEYNQLDLPNGVVESFLSQTPLAEETLCYRLDYQEDANPLQSVTFECDPYFGSNMTCEDNSLYKLGIESVHICNRLMFTNVAANQQDDGSPVLMSDKIRINSTVAYYIGTELVIESVDTYRKVR